MTVGELIKTTEGADCTATDPNVMEIDIDFTADESVYLSDIWARVRQRKLDLLKSSISNLEEALENETLLKWPHIIYSFNKTYETAVDVQEKDFLYRNSTHELYIGDPKYIHDVIVEVRKDLRKNKASIKEEDKILKQIQAHAAKHEDTSVLNNDIVQLMAVRVEGNRNHLIVSVYEKLRRASETYIDACRREREFREICSRPIPVPI